MNYDYIDLTVAEECIYIEKDSGRVQNLEYQCNVLWELIKDIKGVIEMNCPFMVEEDGPYFTNEK